MPPAVMTKVMPMLMTPMIEAKRMIVSEVARSWRTGPRR